MPDIQEIQNIAPSFSQAIPAKHTDAVTTDAVTQVALEHLDPVALEHLDPVALEHLDPARGAVELGKRSYTEINTTILSHIEEAKKHQHTVDLLLQFNQELKEGELTPKLKMLAAELDIKLEGAKLTKEKVSELKSIASSRMESSKSQINIIFSTKISSWQQKLTSIMDIIKAIVQMDQRAKERIQQKTAGR